MCELRVAIFAEGSLGPPPSRGEDPFVELWSSIIPDAVGGRAVVNVFPISKKTIVAMDPDHPPMSGAAEPFDALLMRQLQTHRFNAAVVAWDLVPSWNPQGQYCRWQETLDFHRLLAASAILSEPWAEQARLRHEELAGRRVPAQRPGPAALEPFRVHAIVMEPMFEVLLTLDEGAALAGLGLTRRPPRWPRRGWADPTERRPDTQVVGPAIHAARTVRPKPGPVRRVPGDFRTNKNGWCRFLVRSYLDGASASSAEAFCEHAIARRLAELLPVLEDERALARAPRGSPA